jgi:hypothetical protein
MVDIETDGPIPRDYSMVYFGAVIVEPGLERTFYATLAPISQKWIPEALRVSGSSSEDTTKHRAGSCIPPFTLRLSRIQWIGNSSR